MQQSLEGPILRVPHSDGSNSIEEAKFQFIQDILINESEKLIHSYKLLNYIGQGAFGKVFLGEHIDTKKLYAIKV